MVLLVANVDESQSVGSDAPRITEFSVRRSLASERSQEVTEGIENLDSVVVPIGDDVLPDPVDRHSGEAVEFSVAVSVTSETESVLADFVENLDSVIRRIGDDDVVVGADRDAARPGEQSWLAAATAEGHEETLLLKVLTSRSGI